MADGGFLVKFDGRVIVAGESFRPLFICKSVKNGVYFIM